MKMLALLFYGKIYIIILIWSRKHSSPHGLKLLGNLSVLDRCFGRALFLLVIAMINR
eukprot:SAG11_NODE_2457_length_3342_cov_3.804194_1_plen_57_part_00